MVKLDKFVKNNHFRTRSEPESYNRLRSIYSRRTREPQAGTVTVCGILAWDAPPPLSPAYYGDRATRA